MARLKGQRVNNMTDMKLIHIKSLMCKLGKTGCLKCVREAGMSQTPSLAVVIRIKGMACVPSVKRKESMKQIYLGSFFLACVKVYSFS